MALQDDEDQTEGERPAAEGGAVKERKGLLGPKKEADYDFFVSDIWPRISTKEEKQTMTAPLVWQVLMCAVNFEMLAAYPPATQLLAGQSAACPTLFICWTPQQALTATLSLLANCSAACR